ncbi:MULTISPECIES: carboxymuconolactone decarboxylase family protein [unclassified Nonomuraea]|uniref:carboxymuconolactone decarboxylase family protein n=1 Tax=unclassified Nonomuraea TaxID=2593643 RepID=UPI003399B7B8
MGLTPAGITEALLHSAVYCGMPRALNGTFVAEKVFAERGLLPVVDGIAHLRLSLGEPPPLTRRARLAA